MSLLGQKGLPETIKECSLISDQYQKHYNHQTTVTSSLETELPVHSFIWLLSIILLFLAATFKKSDRKQINRNIQPLSSFPLLGPLLQIAWHKNDIGKLSEKWAKTHGPITKLSLFGTPCVIISSPDMLQKLYSSNIPGHLEKSQFVYLKLFVGTSGKGLFVSKFMDWVPHRKILNKSFNYESLKSYVNVFHKHSLKLVSDLEIRPKRIPECDTLESSLHALCLEAISEIVLGISIHDALTSEEHAKFHKDLHRIKELVTARFLQPWFLVDFLWNLHPCKKEMETKLEYLESIYSKIMQERLSDMSSALNKSNAQSVSVLDEMVSANWSQAEILSEVATLLLGGHETISVALLFIFFLLATEPEHQKACQDEVDTLYEDLESSGMELSMESISQLKYLERCIKETLRMFPPAPMSWRRLEAPLHLNDDITVDAGTTVVTSIWAQHRNPEYFPNPEKFDPDRFLPENCKRRPTHSFIPFSAGIRNCIGWKMAMLEMTTIAATILRNYHLSTTVKLKDVKVNFSFTIWPTKDLNVTLRKRYHKEAIAKTGNS